MSHPANDHYQETVKEYWDEVSAQSHADDEQAEKEAQIENLISLQE